MSTLMVAAGVALGGLGIPSYMDTVELTEQKREWEVVMERLIGWWTLDEMRGLVAQQSTLQPPLQSLQQSHPLLVVLQLRKYLTPYKPLF